MLRIDFSDRQQQQAEVSSVTLERDDAQAWRRQYKYLFSDVSVLFPAYARVRLGSVKFPASFFHRANLKPSVKMVSLYNVYKWWKNIRAHNVSQNCYMYYGHLIYAMPCIYHLIRLWSKWQPFCHLNL